MSTSPYASTHMSEFIGGEITVNGEAIIETGLRDIQSITVSPADPNLVPNEEGFVSWYRYPGSRSKIVIRVEKTGTNSGTLGTNDFQVSFMGLGK